MAKPTLLLDAHLKALRLPTFLREYDKVARQCAQEGLDCSRYLFRLCELELLDREQRAVERRIKAARFPVLKSLETFKFRAIPSVNKRLVLELARSAYLDRRENVLALGNSGTGKTHLALALGLAACQKGYRVRFTTAAALVNERLEARDDKRLLRFQKQLAKQDLLIVDELPQGPSKALVDAIVDMKRRNPRWGCPRIAQQIALAFAVDIDKDVVRRVLATHSRPAPHSGGPSWLTFLGHAKDSLWSMKRRNPRWGCPRIAQQIALAFAVDIDKDVVRRVLATHSRPAPHSGGPSWLTFLGHAKDSLWSIDLFRCESAILRSHWVLVVMDHYTRRIVGFGIHAGTVDGRALCRMFNHAIRGLSRPKRLSSDHDPLYRFHQWRANLRVLQVTEVKSVPYVPLSHPFVERLIGTLRRECVDQLLFWSASDLEDKLVAFQDFYNAHRAHASLDGRTPVPIRKDVARLDRYRWDAHCRGLYQTPIAA